MIMTSPMSPAFGSKSKGPMVVLAVGDQKLTRVPIMKILKMMVWAVMVLVWSVPAGTDTVLQRYKDSSSSSSRSSNNQCNHCCSGPAGPQGLPGMPGLQGDRGQDGRLGAKGDMGDSGSKGFPGDRGGQGSMGPKGRRGRKGGKGECGSTGLPGVQGDLGPTGPIGTQGVPGKRGPKGEQPARIAFTVTRSEPMGPVPQKTPVTFDKIHLNLGDSFDVYSSHFICKVNGTYLFTVHMLSMENQTAYGWLMLNNDHQMAFHGDATARHGTGSNTVILKLVREDHVWIQLNENSAILNHFSSFSGHILFED